VEATQAAEKASDEIKADLKELGLNPNEGSLAWVSTETVELMVNTYQSEDAQLLDPDLNVQDFVFQTEVKWNSTGGLAGCGFFFRSEEDLERGHHYRFLAIRFSGLPVWWALRIQYNTVQDDMTLKYPFSDAINQGQDATNVYTLVAKGNSFTFYANGDRMGTVFNSKIQEGNIAYLVQQESGETTCSFQNSWVWALPLE
jgi:hypothetical protein